MKLLWFIILMAGCTIAPKEVQRQHISFDGTLQDGGFKSFLPDGSGIISEKARQRYNALIGLYGRRFLVPLKPDAGLKQVDPFLCSDCWEIDPEHLVKFQTMSRWHRDAGKVE